MIMINKILIPLTAIFVGANAAPLNAGQDKLQLHDQLGKPYEVVRAALIKAKNLPLSQTNDPNRWCFANEEKCSKYQEISSCANSDQNPCRFEWRSKNGRRFFVVTTGENVEHLVVRNIGYE
jgi:hypothetical protein